VTAVQKSQVELYNTIYIYMCVYIIQLLLYMYVMYFILHQSKTDLIIVTSFFTSILCFINNSVQTAKYHLKICYRFLIRLYFTVPKKKITITKYTAKKFIHLKYIILFSGAKKVGRSVLSLLEFLLIITQCYNRVFNPCRISE